MLKQNTLKQEFPNRSNGNRKNKRIGECGNSFLNLHRCRWSNSLLYESNSKFPNRIYYSNRNNLHSGISNYSDINKSEDEKMKTSTRIKRWIKRNIGWIVVILLILLFFYLVFSS